MIKPDERELMRRCADLPPFAAVPCVDGQHINRRLYILDKWCRRGWVDYGVSLNTAWATTEGVEAFKQFRRSDETRED